MYGKDIPIDYFDSEGNRYSYDEGYTKNYSVTLIGKDKETIFAFDTMDFMQGIMTGAYWYELDHHEYWKDLIDEKTGQKLII